MPFENIHEFTIQGQNFYVLWKDGGCLLRTIESGDNPVHTTVMDMFTSLYDDSPDYELTAEEAIEKAPLIAKHLMVELRKKEVLLMGNFL